MGGAPQPYPTTQKESQPTHTQSPTVSSPAIETVKNQSKTDGLDFKQTPSDTSNNDAKIMHPVKAKIFNTILEPLAEEILKDDPNGKEGGKKCLKALNAVGLTSKDFLEHWTVEEMIKASKELGVYSVAEQRGLKERFEKFLGDVHAYIRSKATKQKDTTSGRVSSEGVQGAIV
jgi:hypothetical protein